MINCPECPWKVRNKHNDTIVKFSKKASKMHNCHMTEGVKNFWSTKKKYLCKNFVKDGNDI